ncbi:MAG: hypothetical protein JEZ02_03580 [Desulfatibacillum sp.]|nr:hypothetical protein [Desulfatibacillum sp.]
MIELMNDSLRFLFPHVHPRARLEVSFVRTLRIPDDGSAYPTPPEMGLYPMVHVDDFEDTVPAHWLERGGVMLPMYQSEALLVRFGGGSPKTSYPFAIKLAAGKVNALTGDEWINHLTPHPQDYAVSPPQEQIDGYCVGRGVVRQFLAMPLGLGYTAEEQLATTAKFGGIQVCAYPMKPEEFQRLSAWADNPFSLTGFSEEQAPFRAEMGLGLGGLLGQDIRLDPFGFDAWDHKNTSRCFVHLVDSALWTAITGKAPPGPAPQAREYNEAGLPYHEKRYAPTPVHEGSRILERLRTVEAP